MIPKQSSTQLLRSLEEGTRRAKKQDARRSREDTKVDKDGHSLKYSISTIFPHVQVLSQAPSLSTSKLAHTKAASPSGASNTMGRPV